MVGIAAIGDKKSCWQLLDFLPDPLIPCTASKYTAAGWEQLDVGATVPRYSPGKKNSVHLRIIQQELNDVLVYPWHKPILFQIGAIDD